MKRNMGVFITAVIFFVITGSAVAAAGPYRIGLKNEGSIPALHYVYEGDLMKVYLIYPVDGILGLDRSLVEDVYTYDGKSVRAAAAAPAKVKIKRWKKRR